jgi:hypothetical protein
MAAAFPTILLSETLFWIAYASNSLSPYFIATLPYEM